MLNVLLKLARGHIRFECNNLLFEGTPSILNIDFIQNFSESQLKHFLMLKSLDLLPEVGSRAMFDFTIDSNNNIYTDWHIVQSNMYEYMVSNNSICVKIIIQNMLVVEIGW